MTTPNTLRRSLRTAASVLLTGALAWSFAACATAPASSGGGSSSDASAPETTTAAAGSSASSTVDSVTLKVGATSVPHAEILAAIKDELAKENITLDVIEYTDYQQLNPALVSGEIDANYFQHTPFLENFNKENDATLVSAVAVHFEPLGVYGGKTKTLADIKDGASVAVPNDTTNEARALFLLEAQGLIKLPEGSDLTVTPKDIAENPKNLKFTEIDAAQVARSLPDVDIGVINGNYALEAGLKSTDALAYEDAGSLAAQTYANIVVVREGDEDRPEIQALVKAITSDKVKDFIETTYEGSVVPVF